MIDYLGHIYHIFIYCLSLVLLLNCYIPHCIKEKEQDLPKAQRNAGFVLIQVVLGFGSLT